MQTHCGSPRDTYQHQWRRVSSLSHVQKKKKKKKRGMKYAWQEEIAIWWISDGITIQYTNVRMNIYIYTYTYILDIRGYMYIHTCVENTNILLHDPWNMRDSMYIHYIHSERYSARGIVSYRASLAEENVSCVRNIIFADQNITRFKSDWSRFFYRRFYEKEIIFFPLSSQSTSFMHTPLYSCANLFIFRANSKNIIYNIRNVSNRVYIFTKSLLYIYIHIYEYMCIYIYVYIYKKEFKFLLNFLFAI